MCHCNCVSQLHIICVTFDTFFTIAWIKLSNYFLQSLHLNQSKVVILGGILWPPPGHCFHARHLHLVILTLPRVGIDVQGGHHSNLPKIISHPNLSNQKMHEKEKSGLEIGLQMSSDNLAAPNFFHPRKKDNSALPVHDIFSLPALWTLTNLFNFDKYNCVSRIKRF